MNLSDLISRYGDDKVTFQKVDDCVTNMQTTKDGTRASFVTPETFSLDGFSKLGLIVWLDREAVAQIIADAKSNAPSVV